MANPLHLYDNFTRTLRPFEPLHPGGEVGLYTCGPTVYDYQHIGEQIDFITDIERNSFAYRTSDGIYFDTSRKPDYGHLLPLTWGPVPSDRSRWVPAFAGTA